ALFAQQQIVPHNFTETEAFIERAIFTGRAATTHLVRLKAAMFSTAGRLRPRAVFAWSVRLSIGLSVVYGWTHGWHLPALFTHTGLLAMMVKAPDLSGIAKEYPNAKLEHERYILVRLRQLGAPPEALQSASR